MLLVADLDDTLVVSHLRAGAPRADYGLVDPLPGRASRLRALLDDGHRVAIATNQAGVSHGYQTEAEVWAKLAAALEALGLPESTRCYVCFAHGSKPILGDGPEWDLNCRKPAPGMLLRAMADHGVEREETVFVGDMESDRLAAAEAAGVRYADADEFFGP